MSYCRTTLVEFNSEKLADEASADYSKNAPSEFPEAEILIKLMYVHGSLFPAAR